MQEQIIELLSLYKGQAVEFALGFEKNGKTLPQHLEVLFNEEFKVALRREKEKFINELEQMVLVWNNSVLLSHLKEKRDQLEENK